MSRVIALSGYKGSGKDTVGRYLISKGYHRLAFADALKDSVALNYGIYRPLMDSPRYKEEPLIEYPLNPKDKFAEAICDLLHLEFRPHFGVKPYDWETSFNDTPMCWTPRALCILEGSVKRAVNPNHWVEKIIEICTNSKCTFVITDLRYRSEAVLLKECLGSEISLVRVERGLKSPTQDPSERDLDGYLFNHTIENFGNISDLNTEIQRKLGI